jgi:hypothetical protein
MSPFVCCVDEADIAIRFTDVKASLTDRTKKEPDRSRALLSRDTGLPDQQPFLPPFALAFAEGFGCGLATAIFDLAALAIVVS